MGSAQPALAEGSTPAGQIEPRSGYVISEQCPLGGADAPSADGSEDLEELWQGRSRPFRLQRQLSLPNLLFEGQGRVGPGLAQPPPLCIPARMGGAIWLYKRPFRHRILRFLLLQRRRLRLH